MEPMFWETLQLSQATKRKNNIGGVSVKEWTLPFQYPTLPQWTAVVGIDPGLNFGLTFLTPNALTIMWGKIPRVRTLPGIGVYNFVCRLILQSVLSEWVNGWSTRVAVFVEGPAYNKVVGQPELEQIRSGFAIGFHTNGCEVQYLAPMRARKLAFGSGTKSAQDIWINLNRNAADSIGLALAGAKLVSQL